MTKETAETEKLAELMRGLEIPPAAAVMGADGFFALGRAIADQAKQATVLQSDLAAAQARVKELEAALLKARPFVVNFYDYQHPGENGQTLKAVDQVLAGADK